MSRHEQQEARRKEALRDLERVGETSEVVGTSAFHRAARGAYAHFSAADAEGDDPAEIWGKRIGRGLSLLILIFLAYHLITTYILR